MGSDLPAAFSLLSIGMITVFVVLFLVVITGNILIRIVNKLNYSVTGDDISPEKIAAISSAIETITKGKGLVTKIEKQ